MQIALGTCVFVALTSCSSTDEDGFSFYEEATPMSEYEVAADTIPPWLTNDPEVRQIAAGSRTPTYDRNSVAIPEPSETVASTGGSFSARQNQGATVPPTADTTEIVAYDPPAIDTPAGSAPVAKVSPPPPTKKGKKIDKPTMVTYTVRAGDNLTLIASRSGTTVEAIRKSSGIKGSLIYPGQKIKVPYTPPNYKFSSSSTGKTTTHTVRRGETLGSIASKNRVSLQRILSANNMSLSDANNISVGQKIKIPSGSQSSTSSRTKTHKVRSGETIDSIARKNGLNYKQILSANNMSLSDAKRLRVGQTLKIPTK